MLEVCDGGIEFLAIMLNSIRNCGPMLRTRGWHALVLRRAAQPRRNISMTKRSKAMLRTMPSFPPPCWAKSMVVARCDPDRNLRTRPSANAQRLSRAIELEAATCYTLQSTLDD